VRAPAKLLKKGATYDDLRRVPDLFIAEILDGDLYASPRPALPHARATGVLLARLGLKRGLDELRAELHRSIGGVVRQMYLAILGQMAVLLGFAYFFATHLR
jgi:hypothetical protein